MKKKSLRNKLELKVKDLSALSGKQKQQVKGGMPPVTFWSLCCVETDEPSCISNCPPAGGSC